MAYSTLRELLAGDPRSRALFDTFSGDAQVALQEQRQNIRSYEELERVAALFSTPPDE